jgi:ABC-type taurine transport system ATPase subunit
VTELRFEAAGAGALLRADARLEPGLWVTVSPSAPALASLVALAGGVQAPALGRVLFDGAPPATSPVVRQRIATLLAFEYLPPGGTVRNAVARVLAARGERRDVDAFLAKLGFLARAGSPINDLDAGERRSLALGLALFHEKARLLALFEPLAANQALEPADIRGLLDERAAAGAVVLVATASHDTAASLGGARLSIENGLLGPALPALAAPRTPSVLYVKTPEAQRLVAAVATDPAVSGVSWNVAQAPELVALYGAELDALGRVLGRAATDTSIAIEEVIHGALAPAALAAPAPQGPYAFQATPGPDPQAARPPDQSVSMPTAFADPTRRSPPEGS